MLIELKNLKVAASLSEETTAYTATIYIDGKPAFHASNHGTGGSDDFHAIAPFGYDDLKRIDAWLAENKPPIDLGQGFKPMPCDLELFVGQLIESAERTKRLTRILKSKITLIDKDKGGAEALFTFRHPPTPENLAKARELLASGKWSGTLVNGAEPAIIERALALV